MKIEELRDELICAFGEHASVECEIDNVQVYLDAIAARRKIAPDLDECSWLMLLDLYRSFGREGVTVARTCAASSYPPAVAVDHVTTLMGKGLVRRVENPSDDGRVHLMLTQKGVNLVSDWFALMHRDSHRQVAVTASSIVSALRTLPR